MERRIILKALALLAGLALASPGWAGTHVITDAAGRQVTVPDAPGRVLAAGPPAAVLLYALAPEKMAGWVRPLSPAEKDYIAAPYRDLPVMGRLTGKGGAPDVGPVLAAKPDLILDVGSVDPAYAAIADDAQARTGVPYVLIDGAFARSPQTIREVGALLGVPDVAEKQAAYAEATLARLAARVAAVPGEERPRVYYGRGPDGLETGLAGSINMEMIGATGGENVAAAAGAGGLTKVTPEQVRGWDPKVILAADPAFARLARSDPAWAGIAAVRAGRVYLVPALPFGWIDGPPGVNHLVGADWLARVLRPGSDPDDPRAEARDFYRLFYHVDLGEAALDTLLAEPAP